MSVKTPDGRGGERLEKKIFGEKYGKGGVSTWFPGHFLLSCLLVYRLYSSTTENGLLFPRHGIAAAENGVQTLPVVESSVFVHYRKKRRECADAERI